ncbi:MAG: hypothetical protein IPK97_08655 [Ahniella sp.]|nr:hypothetical protein [Ahniella sp.]
MVVPATLVQTVVSAYGQSPRAYHGADHIVEVLAQWRSVAAGPGWQQPRETWLALLFHDAVYEAGRRDNEAMSAALARHELEAHLEKLGIDIERVCTLIELTARHGRLGLADVDSDAALMLDCDMAILGASEERFDAYDAAIAEEYRDVLPAWMFRFNRRRFLKHLLGLDRIFLSDFFHERLDAPARANLRRAIGRGRTALAAGAGR